MGADASVSPSAACTPTESVFQLPSTREPTITLVHMARRQSWGTLRDLNETNMLTNEPQELPPHDYHVLAHTHTHAFICGYNTCRYIDLL